MTTVDVLLYDGVDELDFAAPLEILASCRRLVNGRWSDRFAFTVQTVAEFRTPVRTAHGLNIVPDKTFEQAPECDIVIVPGGPGAQRDPLPLKMVEFLRLSRETADVIASVCTGAFIVAKVGLADHHQITTHHARCADLQRLYPKARVVTGQRVVTDGRDGHLMSTGGITCGVDLALSLIQRYEGRDTAAYAAKRLEWPGAPITSTTAQPVG
jgi:transcriptional regulator GlxA family with amidase domain